MAKETNERDNGSEPVTTEYSHEAVLNPEVREAISSLRPEQRSVVIRAIKQELFSGLFTSSTVF